MDMKGAKPGASPSSIRLPNQSGAPAAVEVFIEELVLHGFSPGDRYRLGDAVEQEMARLLTEGGPPRSWAQGTDQAFLDCGRIELDSATPADKIGTRLAEAVVGGLKDGNSKERTRR